MAAPDPIHFCPVCGEPVIQKEFDGKLRPYCQTCDRPFFQDPKVAAAVLVEVDGKVLLVRRANVPEQGKWTLPAGFVDAGEDPRHTAMRECQEETGLQIQIQFLLDLFYGREHARGADIVILYQGKVEAGWAKAGDDALEVGFFSPDELPPLAFDATRKAIRCWLEGRGRDRD